MKEVKRRQEEYEMQKEMALIRKQMKEERKRAEEKRKMLAFYFSWCLFIHLIFSYVM